MQDIVVPEDSELNGLRLTATYTPLTKVTVNSSIAGLSLKVDGVACTTPCEVLRDPGTQVRVSAPASVSQGDGTRADFDGWPGTSGDMVMTVGTVPVITECELSSAQPAQRGQRSGERCGMERVAGIGGRILSRQRECGCEPDGAAGL